MFGLEVAEIVVVVYQLDEFVKEETCVQGARAGFWMELDAEGGAVRIDDALTSSVVRVHEAQDGSVGKAVVFHRIAVVLA